MPTPSVAVVAYPNVSPFHLSVPCILFGDILPGEQLFSLTVCAAEDGPIPAAHGMSVAPGAALTGADRRPPGRACPGRADRRAVPGQLRARLCGPARWASCLDALGV